MKADTKNMVIGFIPPGCPPARNAWSVATAGRQDFVQSATGSFTLVEVVIAMALLVLSLAAFTVSFVQSRRSAAIADNRLDAIHTARDKMETISSYFYGSTGLNIGTKYFSNGFYTVSNNTAKKVKDVVVTIRWVNPLGKITSAVSLAGSVSSELHQ